MFRVASCRGRSFASSVVVVTATISSVQPAPSVFGQTVQIVATGSGGANTTVTFYDGASSIGTGTTTATLSYSAFSVATHTLTAVYNATTSAAVNQTVNQSASQGTLTQAASVTISGTPAVFTSTISAGISLTSVATGQTTIGLTCVDANGNFWGFDSTDTTKLWKVTPAGVATPLTVGSDIPQVIYGNDSNVYACDRGGGGGNAFLLKQPINGGNATTYDLGFAGTEQNFCLGPDGRIWIAGGSAVGGLLAVTTTGTTTHYTTGISGAIYFVCSGPDGKLYATDQDTNTIYKITPATGAVVTSFALDTAGLIMLGSDNNLWILNQATTTVSKCTTSGTITSYATGSAGGNSGFAVLGWDGNLYFLTGSANFIKVATTGTCTNYSAPGGVTVFGITTDLNGLLWFTDSSGNLNQANPGAGTPTLTVTFQDGGASIGTTLLGSGTATLTSSALAPGSHTITALYGGDANFLSSTSSAVVQTVQAITRTASGNVTGTGTSVGTLTLATTLTSDLFSVFIGNTGTASVANITTSSGNITLVKSAVQSGANGYIYEVLGASGSNVKVIVTFSALTNWAMMADRIQGLLNNTVDGTSGNGTTASGTTTASTVTGATSAGDILIGLAVNAGNKTVTFGSLTTGTRVQQGSNLTITSGYTIVSSVTQCVCDPLWSGNAAASCVASNFK